jgi:hypothetical protein
MNLHTVLPTDPTKKTERKQQSINQCQQKKWSGNETPVLKPHKRLYASLKIRMQNNQLRPTTDCTDSPTDNLEEYPADCQVNACLPEYQIKRHPSFIQKQYIVHIQSIKEINLIQCCLPVYQGLAERHLQLLKQYFKIKMANPFWEVLYVLPTISSTEIHRYILWLWIHHLPSISQLQR